MCVSMHIRDENGFLFPAPCSRLPTIQQLSSSTRRDLACRLVVMNINPVTFAARSFRPRQGARCFRTGTRAYPASGSVRSEQRGRGRKGPPPGGLRRIWPGASLLVGHSPTAGMLPPRASPQAKLGATNVTGFMLMTT